VLINGIEIDIEKITDEQLYSLRKVLPRKDYRLLKNRKSARKSRKRRKAELTTLRDEIKALRHENEILKQRLRTNGASSVASSEPLGVRSAEVTGKVKPSSSIVSGS
jgi:hypothetical protein